MDSRSRKSRSPLRSVDPRPMRSPSPSPRGPERAKSYPGPESQQQYGPQPYNPQDYSNQNYNPQNYTSQPGYPPQDFSQQSYGPKPYNPQDYPASDSQQGPKPYNPQDYPASGSQQGPKPYNPQAYPPVSGPQPGPSADLPLRPASESNLLNQPGAMIGAGKSGSQMAPAMGPTMAPTMAPALAPAAAPTTLRELKTLRTNCQFGLGEFLSLQRQRRSGDTGMSSYELDDRIRYQANVVLNDLRVLQGEVRGIAKEAEAHRWRRWIIGGAIATFIPFIRRFWQRNDQDEESSSSANDTEYAFRKSKGLLEYIKNGFLGRGRFAKIAFVVFAVLFVFSNEVSLRVARTTQKRIKKLCSRLENGDSSIEEKDMKLLQGWRWRVLLW